jgi:hypothetical protein
METQRTTEPDRAADRLAGELADVEASIALVSSGAATRVTLSGMRFGQQLADHLRSIAARQGVAIEASFWPEDTACDIDIVRMPAAQAAGARDAAGAAGTHV